MTIDSGAALARLVAYFESMSADDVARLGEFYAADAYFRDPFNDVRGRAEIERIFGDMFTHLAEPRFHFVDVLGDVNGAFLTWNMTFRMRRYRPHVARTIHGASHLKFDANGKVVYHRDYWDAADELYSTLPLIGPVMRFLKRRLA